jgi:hypothetical protein
VITGSSRHAGQPTRDRSARPDIGGLLIALKRDVAERPVARAVALRRPQAQNPELLWLGIGHESLRATDVAGPLQLTLRAVKGPGHFALFLHDAFGQPLPQMNSRDGVDGSDTLTVPLGSHLLSPGSAPFERYRTRLR